MATQTAQAAQNPVLAAASGSTGSTGTSKEVSTYGTARLDVVKEQLAANTARTTAQMKKLESDVVAASAASADIVSAIESGMDAAKTVKLVADTADLTAQNNTIKAYDAAGGIALQTALMQTLNKDQATVAALQEEKQKIISEEYTGIELVDGVIGMLSSVQTDMKLELAQQKLDQTARNIQNITAATESVNRANALTKLAVNESTIAANQKAIAAEYTVKARQAEIQNIGFNSGAMATLAAADSRNLSNLVQAYQLENAEEDRTFQREQFAQRRKEFEHQLEMWKVQLPAAKVSLEQAEFNLAQSKKLGPTQVAAAELNLTTAQKQYNDQLATEESLVTAVQRGQAAATGTVEDAATIIWGLQQPGETGSKYKKFVEIGAVDNPTLGDTAYDAAASLHAISPTGNYKQNSKTRLLNGANTVQMENYAKAKEADPNFKVPDSVEVIRADYNKTVNLIAEGLAKEIKDGDSSNPYHAPPMDSLAEIKAVKSSPLYSKVIAPLGLKEVQAQKIMDSTVAAIQAGTISPEEAVAGITTLFGAAAAYNNTFEGGFKRYGLPSQTSYNARIKHVPNEYEQYLQTTTIINKVSLGTSILFFLGNEEATNKVADVFDLVNTIPVQTVNLVDPTSVRYAIIRLKQTAQGSSLFDKKINRPAQNSQRDGK